MNVDGKLRGVRPHADWWFVEDWQIVARALQFAMAYGRPLDVPRWRMEHLLARVERERNQSLGALARYTANWKRQMARRSAERRARREARARLDVPS